MAEVESHGLAADLVRIEDRWGAHNYRPLDVVVERAAGVWVYALDGRRYLDCLSAYSALNQGHCHPRILQARVAAPDRGARRAACPGPEQGEGTHFWLSLCLTRGKGIRL
jgi:4-aminobutyrate aminotransferase-like enzyme